MRYPRNAVDKYVKTVDNLHISVDKYFELSVDSVDSLNYSL